MRPLTVATAFVVTLIASAAAAQNSTSSLSVDPGVNGESSGTVTGAGPERAGAFGSPPDSPDVGAARGSTRSSAKGSAAGKGTSGAGRGTGTGTNRRGGTPAMADPLTRDSP
jgi:hypothetical protein